MQMIESITQNVKGDIISNMIDSDLVW